MAPPIARGASLARILNLDGNRALVPIALVACILIPDWIGGGAWSLFSRYERVAIHDGEWWRLLTSQFAHLDRGHALGNAAGVALVWVIAGRAWEATEWLVPLVLSLAAVPAGLWWLSPQIEWYVGASGLLHGLMLAGVLALAMREGDRLAWLVLLILCGKLVYEQWVGALPFAGDDPVVPAAHLYGAFGGCAGTLLMLAVSRTAAAR